MTSSVPGTATPTAGSTPARRQKVDATRRDKGRFLRRADDNADDNPAPSAQSGTGLRCNRRRDGRVACSWVPSDRSLVITLAPAATA